MILLDQVVRPVGSGSGYSSGYGDGYGDGYGYGYGYGDGTISTVTRRR